MGYWQSFNCTVIKTLNMSMCQICKSEAMATEGSVHVKTTHASLEGKKKSQIFYDIVIIVVGLKIVQLSTLAAPLSADSFTFLVVRGSGRDGDVVPLGQSVGVPHTKLLSCGDFSQHAVENLKKKQKQC